MPTQPMFLDCPACLDDGATRCMLPAEVEYRYSVPSTAGPIDLVKISCPRRHWFIGPIASLTVSASRRLITQLYARP